MAKVVTLTTLAPLDPPTAVERIYKTGLALQTPNCDVYLTRHQVMIIHAHLIINGKDRPADLKDFLSNILIPASQNRHEGYTRRMRELFAQSGLERLLIDRLVKTCEPRITLRSEPDD